jgi:hypothetical protein
MAILCLASAAAIEVRAVRLTPVSSRLALRVLTSSPLEAPDVRRAGEEVVVALGDASAEGAALPPLEPPVEDLRFERGEGGLTLRVRIAPEVPFEVVRDEALLSVLFGEELADEIRLRSALELYGQLFPVPLGGGTDPTAGEASEGASLEGRRLGRVSIKPGLTASYADADVVTDASAGPTPGRYLQLGPTIEMAMPVADGSIRASYEPRFRFFSSIPEVGTTTHMVNAGLDLPVGPRVVVRGNYHFSHGVLETREVDPGQEYFSDLGRFDRNDVYGSVSVEVGPRVTADVGAGQNDVDFSGSEAFFPYREKTVRAGLGYELGAETRRSSSRAGMT